MAITNQLVVISLIFHRILFDYSLNCKHALQTRGS